MNRLSGWLLAALIAAVWAVGPALPAILHGELIGQPFTDLYPSVWGLDVVASALPRLPLSTERFGAPDGIGFYYSAPIHAIVGWPLWAAFGPVVAYNALVLLARAATVLCTYGWLRAAGLRDPGAIGGAMVYGASPFFQGYAVEGIVEGVGGWGLPLLAWMLTTRRTVPAIFALFLTVASSWYLGMVACALSAVAGFQERRSWIALFGGLALSSPLLWAFGHAFGGNAPLDPSVREAMGAPLRLLPSPGLTGGLNPFAITTWIGLSVPMLAALGARSAPGWLAMGLGCAVLSTGRGPWWELPVLELVRFPYRWHAGTLLCLAVPVAHAIDRLGARWALVPWLEGWLLSPIEPVLPRAPVSVPALYAQVSAPVLLEVPGPVAKPPGVPNASRPRARYLQFAQLHHGARSPWTLDFNGIAKSGEALWLAGFRSYDPVADTPRLPLDVAAARAAGVGQVMVHRDELRKEAADFEAALLAAGATLTHAEGSLALYTL